MNKKRGKEKKRMWRSKNDLEQDEEEENKEEKKRRRGEDRRVRRSPKEDI